MNNDRRVVVTGLGIVSPVGSKIELAWGNIISGKSGVTKIKQFDTSNFHTDFAASILDFIPEDYISSKDARRTDLFIQYGIAAANDSINDSELNISSINPE